MFTTKWGLFMDSDLQGGGRSSKLIALLTKQAVIKSEFFAI